MKPAATYEGVCADLRSAISNEAKCHETLQFLNNNSDEVTDTEVNWTDRTHGGRGRDNGMNNNFQKNTKTMRSTVPRENFPKTHQRNQIQRQKRGVFCAKKLDVGQPNTLPKNAARQHPNGNIQQYQHAETLLRKPIITFSRIAKALNFGQKVKKSMKWNS